MRSVWVGFWRFWLHRKMGWQVRGSLDAYPQHLVVIIGPDDNRHASHAILAWRAGWKNRRNRTVWSLSSRELSEASLVSRLEQNVAQGKWLVPIGVDVERRKINIHTPFHRSAHPERDAAYIARYFDYHRKRD